MCILSFGNEKTRVTTMVSCLADGHKLKLNFTFTGKRLPSLASAEDVIVWVRPKGWMKA